MPGHGVAWNEAISKDWGGKAIQDYLDAIDDIAKESYVDNERLGAIGASFGGYSVFQLAGLHNKRFKTFISHDGVFDLRSMYGTTEEMFFVNHDIGGAYWDKDNAAAQKSYQDFNPSNFVAKWDTPMLVIHGGKDYRVPLGQGIQAYQAAQLQGLKSRLLYFPEENHWVLSPQNGLVWQREFFRWLDETL
jgi:dipeptidyl aminopeptidase/acylaminoacyl peptidase